MEMNIHCIRDIMLTVQEHSGLDYGCKFLNYRLQSEPDYQYLEWTPEPYQDKLDKEYGYDVVLYHLDLCFEAGYLVETPLNKRNYMDKHFIHIFRPTFSGHEFIENTKPEPMWKAMVAAAKRGVSSLPTIVSVAKDTNIQELLQELALMIST